MIIVHQASSREHAGYAAIFNRKLVVPMHLCFVVDFSNYVLVNMQVLAQRRRIVVYANSFGMLSHELLIIRYAMGCLSR
jgi:hypothetical protein